ncbi:MAG: hypothetical protein IKG18_08025 [Atopobiaceae bacterium]|nr:hypothetical protein [Atopobiaceae bacterium]
MRIAVAQINTRAGDFGATSQRMIELSHRAASEGADLLVFPTAALTGSCLPDYGSLEGYAMDMGAALEEIAGAAACPCLIPVMMSKEDGTSCETMLIREGSAVPVGLMSWILGGVSADADKAPERSAFEFEGVKFGVAYSYDDIRALVDADSDVDVLLYLPERGFALDDPSSALGASLLEGRFRDDAWSLDAWVVGVGSLGGYDLQVFSGSSFVLSPKGELMGCAPAFEEAFLVVDMPSDGVGATAEPLEPELYDRSLHLWEALSLGLRDQLAKEGDTDVALVLDGRLDSSVLATMASDALGPLHVYAIIDTSQDDAHQRLASQLARSLGINVLPPAVPLPDTHDMQLTRDVVQVQLAALARGVGAVPLASFDKTFVALEARIARGSAATLAPLGDVYRTDVIELAHLRNTISPVIDAASIASYDVPEIDGLAAAETSPETRLQRVDVTLATFIEWERSLSDTASRQGHEDVCAAILDRLCACELARLALPPSIAVSSRTVREMRVPLGLAWHDVVRSEDDRARRRNLLAELADAFETDDKSPTSDAADARMASEVASILERMQDELGSQAPTNQQDSMERQVSELLGLLRDILQDGGLVSGDVSEFPLGPLTWGSPFSEN